jgi:hypothetical protein
MKKNNKDRLLKIVVWTIILSITIILWQTILLRLFPLER